ncbi:hypothetical protein DNFV4_01258 [Nitrospira tepida]|uniref:Uncharacterized protein n=1 Tax=Nitrospira tepida TaxID=2973512 RepID=A0AA86MXG2_9BACT|nr:hypothetical protein [Nitrospira tepida]CAI4030828.1 hypothetical protein DNFV4_01258 [Nitrospira tepida]
MTSLKVQEGEILVQGHFARPIFGILDPPASRVHSAFFTSLAPFGININDVKLAHGVPNLSEASVTYPLLNFSSMVKLSLDKMEVACFNTSRLQRDEMSAIFTKSFHSLIEIVPETEIREFAVNISLHTLLDDKQPDEFWRSFLPTVPRGIGPSSGQGVVFYYGGHDKTTASSLVFDMSARVSGGIFFRTSINFDGAKVSIEELPSAAEQAFNTLSSNLDLTLT